MTPDDLYENLTAVPAEGTAPAEGKQPKPKVRKDAAAVLSGRAKPRMTSDEDGNVILKDVPLYTPLLITDDLSPLLRQFGMDPDKFEVIKDSFSSWMQSASDGAGGRDVVYLYSAKFRRIAELEPEVSNEAVLKRWRSVLIKGSKPILKPTFKEGVIPGTYAMWPSDLQLGKERTVESVANFQHGITEGLKDCARLIDSGVAIEGIHIGWGGDETEGIANNYTNQPHIIELNQSEQLTLDTDLRIWAIKEAMQMGLALSASSTISNHGDWGRNGGKDTVTVKGDNSSTYVAREVKRLFDELEPHTGHHIDWTIGGIYDKPGIIVNLSGEKVYSSHGHIEKGRGASTELRTKNAIEKQLLGDILAERRLLDVRLFVMAHYHHWYQIEDRGRIVMGLPALEAERSSAYMDHMFGTWSYPGLAAMVVGRFPQRPYRHLNVFGRVSQPVPESAVAAMERVKPVA